MEGTQALRALVLVFYPTNICGAPGMAETALGGPPTGKIKMNTHPSNQTTTKSRTEMLQAEAPKQTGTDGKAF